MWDCKSISRSDWIWQRWGGDKKERNQKMALRVAAWTICQQGWPKNFIKWSNSYYIRNEFLVHKICKCSFPAWKVSCFSRPVTPNIQMGNPAGENVLASYSWAMWSYTRCHLWAPTRRAASGNIHGTPEASILQQSSQAFIEACKLQVSFVNFSVTPLRFS